MRALEIEPAGGDTGTPLNLAKRLAVIRRFAGDLRNLRVLDCGCGAGEYVAALGDEGALAFGIEYQEGKLVGAGDLRARSIANADVQIMPFADEQFDLALLNEVLEHVPDESRSLREIRRVLRPGGRLIVFSPNRLYPFETHGVYLRGSDRRVPHYTPLIPYVPIPLGRLLFDYWARNYWPWELRKLIRSAGFEVVATDFIWQTFENISGHQPGLIRALGPVLRRCCNTLERIRGFRGLGVSQALMARRSE